MSLASRERRGRLDEPWRFRHAGAASRHRLTPALDGVEPLLTPDGRYIVVRGRLWRAANPHLATGQRDLLVQALMSARREVKAARAAKDAGRLSRARQAVQAAKVGLGERGPVWWQDGARDFNRHLVKNTPYRTWYEQVSGLRT